MKKFVRFENFVFSKKALLTLLLLLSVSANAQKYEAENGTLSSCEVITDSKFSGNKAVRMTDGQAKLTMNINMSNRQKYKIYVASEGIGGAKDVRCSVNDASTIFNTNSYGEVEIGTFILNEGNNSIVITPSWTWYNIDYVRIEEGGSTIAFDIPDSPVTADATPAAKQLYSFLKENFGHRTISGMMTGSMDGTNGSNILLHEDIVAVHDASGHYPVLVGFDFMNSTGKSIDQNDSWYIAYTKKVISLAKDTWRRGGIPDFTWHWRDPSRQTNEFYTQRSSIDFTEAMNSDGSWNTSSTLYKNIIKDIDIVAEYFLQLQKEDMACIFRPLHEASGGWFWWGSKGAEACKKLYRLIYDEMVNVKGVRNVIWDWNADYTLGDKWCPGTDYFDVISTDIYNNQYDYSSNYPAFDKLKETTGGKKIIALAENGPIPDIDNMDDDEAMWSWWMPWYQSWNGGFVDKTSQQEWKKCMSDSRVITLDEMPGWNSNTSIETLHTPAEQHTIYTLTGIRQTTTSQGVMIVDGKKVLITK